MSLHPQMASFSSLCAVTSCRRMRSSRILSCLILLLLCFSSTLLLFCFFLFSPPAAPILPSIPPLSPPPRCFSFSSPFLLLLRFPRFSFNLSSISSSTLHILLVLHLHLWHQLLLENEEEEEEASFSSLRSPPLGEQGAAAVCLFSSCCSSFSLPPSSLSPPLSFIFLSALPLLSLLSAAPAGNLCWSKLLEKDVMLRCYVTELRSGAPWTR